MSRVRPLIIAEAANPEWVSVPLVGWSHSRAIAQVTDAHVVTQIRNRGGFEVAGLREGEDFTAIDTEVLARKLFALGKAIRGDLRTSWTTGAALESIGYYYFEWLVWKRFSERIERGEFDLIHRITPLSPTAQSILSKKANDRGVPFVLGPLNGGLPWPRQFRRERRREREWLSHVRWLYRLLPYYGSTLSNASAILVGSRHTLEEIPAKYHGKCVYMPENGIDPDRFAIEARTLGGGPLRIIFAGRLVPYKGADMLLSAVSDLVRARKVTVEIVGDGPESRSLRELVSSTGIEEGVTFAGWVPHEDMPARLAQAEIFVAPSIREFGGGTVLEAMALGLVPVVVAYGGPCELVTPETGFLIPMATREEITRDIRQTIEGILRDRNCLARKRELARARALSSFTWRAKAAQTLEVYEWVLGRRATRPSFGLAEPDPCNGDPRRYQESGLGLHS